MVQHTCSAAFVRHSFASPGRLVTWQRAVWIVRVNDTNITYQTEGLFTLRVRLFR